MEADLDPSTLVELRKLGQGRDPLFFSKLIGIFLSDTEKSLAALSSAFESGDRQGIKWGAHRIRGGAGSFGARTLARICMELESLPPGDTDGTMRGLIDALREEFVRVRKALETEARA